MEISITAQKLYDLIHADNCQIWDREWVHNDNLSAEGVNIISGEKYFKFDGNKSGSGLYMTTGQAKKEYGIDPAKHGLEVFAARFRHIIEGISNHGKHAVEMYKQNMLPDIDIYTGIRESVTRHFVVDARAVAYASKNLDLWDRCEMFELNEVFTPDQIEVPAELWKMLANYGIGVFVGYGRQPCSITSINTKTGVKTVKIILPTIFESETAKLATFCHELTHAIGGRLGIHLGTRAAEEVCAELGGLLMCLALGHDREFDSYLPSWGRDLTLAQCQKIIDNLRARLNRFGL